MKNSEFQKTVSSNSCSRKPFFNQNGIGDFFSQTKEPEKPFFNPSPIQTKLAVGRVNDKQEQDVDITAEKVVRKLGDPNFNSPIQRKCEKCAQEEELQMKKESAETIPVLQIPFVNDGAQIQSQAIESQLNASKGTGKLLEKNIRSDMESAFGADFGSVKIHTDAASAQMNRELGAKAFTHGQNIFFNDQQYNPESIGGKKLLAHELTHTIQQKNNSKIIQRKPTCGKREPNEAENSAINPQFHIIRLQPYKWLIYGFPVGSLYTGPISGEIAQLFYEKVINEPAYEEMRSNRQVIGVSSDISQFNLTGYSDCHGGDALNTYLRRNRAHEVKFDITHSNNFILEDMIAYNRLILEIGSASNNTYLFNNDTPENRKKNRGVLIERIVPTTNNSESDSKENDKLPKRKYPFDPTYGPKPANCSIYLGMNEYTNKHFSNNAFCACIGTPDDPENNCVRKCLQEKLNYQLNTDDSKNPFWCAQQWGNHRDCYKECSCDNSFTNYDVFQTMCNYDFPCDFVGFSIKNWNSCKR